MDLTIESIMWIVFGAITLLVVLFALMFGFRRTLLQSGIRFGVLIVTVIICAILTAVATSMAINYAIEYAQTGELGSNEVMNELLTYVSGETAAAQDLKQIVGAIVAPVVFLVLFIVLNLITFIIYAIVTACTLSQGHKKRQAKRQGEKYKSGGLNRLGSLGVNLVTCFAFAAILIMPITFYAQLGATVMDEVVATSGQIGGSDSSSSDIQEYQYDAVAASSKISEVNFNDATETMTFYRDVLAGVSENPFGSAYTAVGGLVADNVTRLNTTSDANNVTSVSLRTFVDETKTVINSVVTIATSDDLSNITASNIYDIAKSLQNNKFADELLGGLISDAADAWSNGGSFLGYPREILGESEIVDSICNALKDKSNASDALLAVGHVVSVAQVMNIGGIGGDEEQDSTEVMKNLMDNLSDDSIDIVSSVVSGTLKSSLGNNLGEPGTEEYETRMDKVSELVNDMLKELQKVQKTDDQEKIDREAAAVATVFDTVKSINTLEEEDAKAAVKAVKDSEVLKNTLKKFVDDNPNPLDTKFDNEEQKASAKETVTEALASMEISPSNELYDIILSLFGLKD